MGVRSVSEGDRILQNPVFAPTAIILSAAFLLVSSCGGVGNSAADSPKESPSPRVVRVDIEGFAFLPDRLQGEVGQFFEVRVVNPSRTRHTFTIDEFGVHYDIPLEGDATFPVLPSEPGEFTFYCKFHEAQGMTGSITVSRAPDGAGPSQSPSPSGDGY